MYHSSLTFGALALLFLVLSVMFKNRKGSFMLGNFEEKLDLDKLQGVLFYAFLFAFGVYAGFMFFIDGLSEMADVYVSLMIIADMIVTYLCIRKYCEK